MERLCKTVICLLVLLGGCNKVDEVKPRPLRVGTNVWPGYEPLYVAREMKLYPGDPIKLVEFSSATQVLSAFRNGVIDAAALTLDEAILLEDDGFDIRVVLIFDYSFGADVLLGKPEIADIQGLRGKTVAVEANALGAYTLALALKAGGLKRSDVVVEVAEVDVHEEIFARESVDAVVTFEPARSRLLAAGAKVLFSSREAPGKIIDALVVRASVVEKRGEQLKNLLAGYFAARQKVQDRDEVALGLVAKRLHLEMPQVLAALDGFKSLSEAENREFLVESGGALEAAVAQVLEFMDEQQLVARGHKIHMRTWVPALSEDKGQP